jgi:hypothetical protein
LIFGRAFESSSANLPGVCEGDESSPRAEVSPVATSAVGEPCFRPVYAAR